MFNIFKYIKEPWRIPLTLQSYGLGSFIQDKIYIKAMFREKMGYPLNLKNPITFNEKLQWLKLNDHKQEYIQMVDKYEAKNYVSRLIGKQFIIPTLGVWNSFDDIDFEELPNRFVLKCTHDSGGVYIVKNKKHMNMMDIKHQIEVSLYKNYYLNGREWPYKYIKPRIIAEEFMEDGSGELKDYKFFCFDGKVKFFKIDFNRAEQHRANYFSPKGELLMFGEEVCPPQYDKRLDVPSKLRTMIQLAEKLSTGITFLRVDLYVISDEDIRFGELTFYPAAGFGKFIPEYYDEQLGKLINLPSFVESNSNKQLI